ncbi:MAG: arginine--tRNA ligase [archaeon]
MAKKEKSKKAVKKKVMPKTLKKKAAIKKKLVVKKKALIKKKIVVKKKPVSKKKVTPKKKVSKPKKALAKKKLVVKKKAAKPKAKKAAIKKKPVKAKKTVKKTTVKKKVSIKKKAVKAKKKAAKPKKPPEPKEEQEPEKPNEPTYDPWQELKNQAQAAIEEAVKTAKIKVPSEVNFATAIEEPPSAKMGDVACSIAFSLGRASKKNPRQLAELLISKVKKPPIFKKVALAGAYINFFLDHDKFAKHILAKVVDDDYGRGGKKGDKVMAEFCQVNTHKAFHIGHIRGTILGETISRILEYSGYEVVRANYQGDIGSHVAKWMWYYNKFKSGESPHGKGETWLANIYRAATQELREHPEYEKETSEILQKLEAGEDEKLMQAWRETRQWSLDEYEKIYKELDVRFDRYFFESEMGNSGKEIVDELLKKKIAKMSEGAIVINLEKFGLGTYLLLKSDGTALYSTKDLALAKAKFEEFGIDISLYVVGSEQRLYFQQLFKTLELMGFKRAKKCHHLAFDLISLKEGKMSSREGTAILYSELRDGMFKRALEEVMERNPEMDPHEQKIIANKVAYGAMKFDILNINNNKTIFFDWEKALEFEGETAPYVQYAGVRCKRILEKAGKVPETGKVDFGKLKLAAEHELVKMLARFPGVIATAAKEYKPHFIANYVYGLADKFSTFYTEAPIMDAGDKATKDARLMLLSATYKTLEKALYLLGIEIPERM